MDLLLLAVVGHALQVAAVVDLLDYLVHVALDVLPHAPQLLHRLPDLVRLDLADLGTPLGLFVHKVQVLVPDVLEVLEERAVEIRYGFLLDLVALLYFGQVLLLLLVAVLKFLQSLYEVAQLLPSSGVGGGPRNFLYSPGRLIGQYFLNFEATTRKVDCAFAAVVEILLVNFNFELGLNLGVVGAGPSGHGDPPLGDGSAVGDGGFLGVGADTVPFDIADRSMIALRPLVLVPLVVLLVEIPLPYGRIIDILLAGHVELDSPSIKIAVPLNHFSLLLNIN